MLPLQVLNQISCKASKFHNNYYKYSAMTSDHVNGKSETILMKAAANGHWEVCKILLMEQAKVNHHDANYQTALMWAAAEGHLETVG